MKNHAGYEDAVAQYLSGRESQFTVARVLSSISQASTIVDGLLYSIYNLSAVLSDTEYLIDFTASMPEDSETLDVRGTIYTFVTGSPAVAYEVKIQGSAALMGIVFEKAINGEYSSQVYAGTEINPYFSAVDSSGAVTLTARKTGRKPNDYELTDWDGTVLSPSTEGSGCIPILETFVLDIFGSFMFAGGGRDIQGQGKSASRRYELAKEVLKDYISGETRLVDENADPIAFRASPSHSSYDVSKDGYSQQMADKGDAFYVELRLRKGLD